MSNLNLSVRTLGSKAASLKVGERIGKLVITGPPDFSRDDKGRIRIHYPCHCDCGTDKLVSANDMIWSKTRGCGCIQLSEMRKANTTHGGSKTRLYRTWAGMIGRCTLPSKDVRGHYLARGITVCEEWRGSFEAFRDWALAHGYTDEMTIERGKVDGNYEPSNCSWIPRAKQSRNTRRTRMLTAFGETKHFVDWVNDARCLVTRNAFHYRLEAGWTAEEAMMTPVRGRRVRTEAALAIDGVHIPLLRDPGSGPLDRSGGTYEITIRFDPKSHRMIGEYRRTD